MWKKLFKTFIQSRFNYSKPRWIRLIEKWVIKFTKIHHLSGLISSLNLIWIRENTCVPSVLKIPTSGFGLTWFIFRCGCSHHSKLLSFYKLCTWMPFLDFSTVWVDWKSQERHLSTALKLECPLKFLTKLFLFSFWIRAPRSNIYTCRRNPDRVLVLFFIYGIFHSLMKPSEINKHFLRYGMWSFGVNME